MKNKKILFVISIAIFVIMFSGLIIENPRLIDRTFYRLGFQEQVCFPTEKEFGEANHIVAAGDFGINMNSRNVLKNMMSIESELIVILGDNGQSTADNWFELTKEIPMEKTHTVIGDADINEIDSYLENSGQNSEFYSFDYENIHFLIISSKNGIISDDHSQLEFIKKDLEKNHKNSKIDWTIVAMHFPMYSSTSSKDPSDLINNLQPIFDLQGVDLVLNGHKHAYERSIPLMQNFSKIFDEKCLYEKNNGQIYVTVGTGGHSHSIYDQKESWSVIQNHNDFGFLKIMITKDGKILYGEFINNNGKVMDAFQIKSDKNIGSDK